MHIGFLDETKDIYIYQNEEMLIKSQVTRMHVLNICVSLTVHDTVCLHNLESRLLHNISS